MSDAQQFDPAAAQADAERAIALAKDATPEPWEVSRTNWRGEPDELNRHIIGDVVPIDPDEADEESDKQGSATGVAVVCGNPTSQSVTAANARLIAASRTLLPSLAAYLRAALAEVERLTEEVDILRGEARNVDIEYTRNIAALRERVAALGAAAQPFADMLPAIAEDTVDEWPLTDELDRSVNWPATEVKCGHVRRLAALLAEPKPAPTGDTTRGG